MANTFAMLLAIATLITGIVWGLEHFKWGPVRYKKVALIKDSAEHGVGSKLLKKLIEPPSWVDMLASFFPVLAIVFIIRSFLYEPFQIPSGSMMPTLLVGDFILVHKSSYGVKNPLNQVTWIAGKTPERGDVIVFKYPKDISVDYIKRVIGIPGDTVHYNVVKKTITVTPFCHTSNVICPKSFEYKQTNLPTNDFVQGYEQLDNGNYQPKVYQLTGNDEKELANFAEYVNLNERIEEINEDIQYDILINPAIQPNSAGLFRQPGMPIATWKVPVGHYFTMGDNRDNSLDSRYWGFVPEQNVVGKAVAIWFSFEKREGEWPTGVRLSRIGAIH